MRPFPRLTNQNDPDRRASSAIAACPSAAQLATCALEKILPAPAADAAHRRQALFVGMKAAVVRRCAVECAPRRRVGIPGCSDQEQERETADQLGHGIWFLDGAALERADPPIWVLQAPCANSIDALRSCFVRIRNWSWVARLQLPSALPRHRQPHCRRAMGPVLGRRTSARARRQSISM